MLISIHSRSEFTVELEPLGTPRRAMFVDIGDGQSILLSREEAMHLYMQLGGALDELDRADEPERLDVTDAVVQSIPLWVGTSA